MAPIQIGRQSTWFIVKFQNSTCRLSFFSHGFRGFFLDVEFLLLGQRLRVVVDWEKEESSAHTRYSFFLKPSVSPISSTDMASQSASRHRRCFDTRETQQGGSPGAEDLEAAPPKKKQNAKQNETIKVHGDILLDLEKLFRRVAGRCRNARNPHDPPKADRK